MEPYHVIADAIAADIAAGRLRPGDRLPPQRHFARRRGIAPSTAARVYAELVRRGLVVGEVGRGHVRAGRRAAARTRAHRAGRRARRPGDELPRARGPVRAPRREPWGCCAPRRARREPRAGRRAGTGAARLATATLLTRAGWTPDPDRVVFAGNGRQAIAAAIAALVPVG